MHIIENLPDFLKEEVKESIIEFEQKTDQHFSDREMAIFSFGFEYGQRNILRLNRERKLPDRK